MGSFIKKNSPKHLSYIILHLNQCKLPLLALHLVILLCSSEEQSKFGVKSQSSLSFPLFLCHLPRNLSWDWWGKAGSFVISSQSLQSLAERYIQCLHFSFLYAILSVYCLVLLMGFCFVSQIRKPCSCNGWRI